MKRIGLCIGGIIFLLISLYGCAGMNGKSVEMIDKSDSVRQNSVSLGAPTMLKLIIIPNGFKLDWKDALEDRSIVTGYEIVRSDSASGPFTRIATVDKGVFQYIDTTASPEIIYYYKIRAIAGTVYSPYSNTVTGER